MSKNKENIIIILDNLDINYDIEDYDYKKKNLQIKFTLSKLDKENILRFYEENKEIYEEKTEETEEDLKKIENIYVMFNKKNMYFGKTEYDYTAISIASLFLVEIYLDDVYEEIIYNLNK